MFGFGCISGSVTATMRILFILKKRFCTFLDLRGYRLFVRISAALGGFMFTKRANRGAMRKS